MNGFREGIWKHWYNICGRGCRFKEWWNKKKKMRGVGHVSELAERRENLVSIDLFWIWDASTVL